MSLFDKLLIEPLRNFVENLMRFLPNILTSLLILIIGIVLAFCLKIFFHQVFRFSRLDSFLDRSGLSELLKKSGMKGNLSVLLAKLIGWFTFLVFLLTAINMLQIQAAGRLFEDFLLYLPHLFTALLIFLIGYLLSNFFYRTVLIAAVNADNRFAGLIGKVVKYAVILLAVSMALEQLGIGKGTVVIAFAIIFGGVVLACAIAFGLGGRDAAKTYLEKHLKQEQGEEKDEIDHL